MRLKAVLAALSLVLLGFVLIPAQPALAVSECNAAVWRTSAAGNHKLFFPYYRSADGRTTALNCLLRQGDYDNWGVVALQNMLIKCYGQSISRDGDFGPATRTALMRAQTWERITADGVYGWQSHTRLMWPWYPRNGSIDGTYSCNYIY
jgi:hypothetical protein